MRRSRVKVTVSNAWFDAAEGQAKPDEKADCANCASKSDNISAFIGETTNGGKLPEHLAQLAQSTTNGEKLPEHLAQLAQSATLRQLRHSTLSSFTRNPPPKGNIYIEDLAQLAQSPRAPAKSTSMHRCNDCLLGIPPDPPADQEMGWHLCIAGYNSGWGNKRRRCSAWRQQAMHADGAGVRTGENE